MKKIIRYFWPIFIMPALYLPYSFLNQYLIVNWLGCGCARLDNSGNYVINYFNANDFTSFFWFFAAAAVIILSSFVTRKMDSLYLRIIFISLTVVISLFTANGFYMSMLWK